MLRVVAAGTGSPRPLIIVYHLTGGSQARPTFIDDRVRAAAPGATIANYTAPVDPARGTTGGAYRSVGNKALDGSSLARASDVRTSLEVKLRTNFDRLVLVGFSEGCQAPRAQLLASEQPDAILACDGIHGGYPTPDEATEVRPWQTFADAARAGDVAWIATHTMIPTEPKFTMAQHMIQRVIRNATALAPGPDKLHPNTWTEGRAAVYSYPGTDAIAHSNQAQCALPLRLRDLLVLAGIVPASAPFAIDCGEGSATEPILPPPATPSGAWGPAAVAMAILIAGGAAIGSALAARQLLDRHLTR